MAGRSRPGDARAPLVEEGLAACVNALPPMQSTYRWQGAVQVEMERQLIIKARRDRLEALHARLVSLHPYDVPEFLILDVAGGATSYVTWLRSS